MTQATSAAPSLAALEKIDPSLLGPIDWANADLGLMAAPAILGFVGLLLFFVGLARVFKLKLISGGGGALVGALLMALGVAGALIGLNLHTYNRLSFERPIAEISLRQTGEQAFIATVRYPEGEPQEFALSGDQWQMDARVLKWKPWANVLGLDAMYKLDRLGGRYVAIEDETTKPRTVYALGENPGLDLWRLATEYSQFAPMVDASYGSGTFLPMADGAAFEVSLTQSGLIARPTNTAGEAAVANPW